MPACREDICQEDEVAFVGCAGGEGETVEIGVADAEVLGLAALVGTHCYVAVSTACETAVDCSLVCVEEGYGKGAIRIHASAESCLSLFAVPAAAVGDVEGHYYSVAFFEEGNSRAGFDYDSHVFVACKPNHVIS